MSVSSCKLFSQILFIILRPILIVLLFVACSILYSMDELTLVTIVAATCVAIALFVMMRSMISLENEQISKETERQRPSRTQRRSQVPAPRRETR